MEMAVVGSRCWRGRTPPAFHDDHFQGIKCINDHCVGRASVGVQPCSPAPRHPLRQHNTFMLFAFQPFFGDGCAAQGIFVSVQIASINFLLHYVSWPEIRDQRRPFVAVIRRLIE